MKILVKNPLDKEIKIQFKGKEFILAANEEKELDAEVVTHWKRLHAFLEIKREVELPDPIPQALPPQATPAEFPKELPKIEEAVIPKNKGGRPKKIK